MLQKSEPVNDKRSVMELHKDRVSRSGTNQHY